VLLILRKVQITKCILQFCQSNLSEHCFVEKEIKQVDRLLIQCEVSSKWCDFKLSKYINVVLKHEAKF